MEEEYIAHPNEAWSWPYGKIPDDSNIVEIKEKLGRVWIYFADDKGDLWYATDKGLLFASEMEKKNKKRR